MYTLNLIFRFAAYEPNRQIVNEKFPAICNLHPVKHSETVANLNPFFVQMPLCAFHVVGQMLISSKTCKNSIKICGERFSVDRFSRSPQISVMSPTHSPNRGGTEYLGCPPLQWK